MTDQPQQQPQVTPEMLKKLQGEKEEKEKVKPAFGPGNKHWIVKLGKDIAYISFFPYLWVKDFLSWLFTKKQGKLDQSVNINKTDNPNIEVNNDGISNKKGQISLEEVEPSASEATNSSSSDTSQRIRRNSWQKNMASNCVHQEPTAPVKTTPKKGLVS